MIADEYQMALSSGDDSDVFEYGGKTYHRPTLPNLQTLVQSSLQPMGSEKARNNFEKFRECFDKFVECFNIELGRIDDIFKTPYRVRNQMITCRLLNRKFPAYKYSLKVLKDSIICSFWMKGRTPPNLSLFDLDSAPVIMFTENGRVTVTGGNNRELLCHRMFNSFETMIRLFCDHDKRLQPADFFVGEFEIKNRLATNRLMFHKINLHGFVEKWKRHRPTNFQPMRIGIVYFHPLPEYSRSLRASIFPTGGMNLMGATSSQEIRYLAFLMGALLRPFLLPSAVKLNHWEVRLQNGRVLAEYVRAMEIKTLTAKLIQKAKKVVKKLTAQILFDMTSADMQINRIQ